MKLFLYILSASSNQNYVECLVPYLVNEKELFFGPCKRLLRKNLKDKYLKTSSDLFLEEDVFVIGFNGSNREKKRKIVWAGRITKLMTFETAYLSLISEDYQKMRERNDSPLHLKPLYDDTGKFLGYEHISLMHINNDGWIRDLIRTENPQIIREGNKLLFKPFSDRNQAFPRDCCILLDNIFFANGSGITINKEMVDTLIEVQPEREGISDYSIFGLRVDGSADGRTGRWLEISGNNAQKFFDLLKLELLTVQSRKTLNDIHLKSCSCK